MHNHVAAFTHWATRKVIYRSIFHRKYWITASAVLANVGDVVFHKDIYKDFAWKTRNSAHFSPVRNHIQPDSKSLLEEYILSVTLTRPLGRMVSKCSLEDRGIPLLSRGCSFDAAFNVLVSIIIC
eukprot:TRINITY_DN3038_c0_g1_i1.p1 TRINITY_DN3038_c0_g1~~TRINITY_DN3038_c0_g1_i1.p1  ORF type:complete len:125 (+),score=5.20 TRINITY_DN3038_c0_g1_i1:283-657(+)